jgi:tetratricopeptide (TPR) repeat protein
VQIDYLKREQPQKFEDFHHRAAAYYADNEELERLYHRFFFERDMAFEDWMEWEAREAYAYNHAVWEPLLAIIESAEIELTQAQQAERHYRRGNQFYYGSESLAAREQYNTALPIYRAIGARLGEANCLWSLGDVLWNTGNHQAAREQYEQAIHVYDEIGSRQGAASATGSLGILLAQMGYDDHAVRVAEDCIRRYSELNHPVLLATGYMLAGNVYSEIKRYADAVEAYRRAISHHKSDVASWLNLANTYRKLLKPDDAQSALDSAEQIQATHPYILPMRAESYVLQGDANAALLATDEAFNRLGSPQNFIWVVRSLALLMLNRKDEALQAAHNAVQETADPHRFDDFIDDIILWQSVHADVAGTDAVLKVFQDAKRAAGLE